MASTRSSIRFALIHNNDLERNAYIQPRLEDLASAANRDRSFPIIEVAHQPALEPHGTALALTRQLIYGRLDREWRRYRKLSSGSLLSTSARFARQALRMYVLNRGGAAASWRRNSAIEVTVSEKHIRAWGQFLDSDGDFLVCLEDDAVFKEDSLQRLRELTDLLTTSHADAACYADLAGGCQLSELAIDRLETGRSGGYRHYERLVTNTACAYLMSRQLVEAFYEYLTRRPRLRLIGIDWMMNKLFMIHLEAGKVGVCLHADPTIFDHGTTAGHYVSWRAPSAD